MTSKENHLQVKKVKIFDIPNPEPDPTANDLWTFKRDARVRLRLSDDGVGSNTPETVHTLFASSVQRFHSRPALAYKKDSTEKQFTYISYIEYYQMVVTAAKGFLKLNLEPKASVGILGFNSVEWFVSYLAAIFAGGYACGIYATNSSEVCLYIIQHANIEIIVVEDVSQANKILSVRDKIPNLRVIIQWKGEVPDANDSMLMTWEKFMTIGEDVDDSKVEERLIKQVPNECCTLIYTSGTTGNPKGVMLSHDNLSWTIAWMIDFGELKGKEIIILSYLPLSHIAAQIVDIFGSIKTGGIIYFAQPDALKGSLGQSLLEVRPTIFLGVPRVWEKIQEKITAIGKTTTGLEKKITIWAKGIGYRGSQAEMNGEATPWGWFLANFLVLRKVRKKLGLDRCFICITAAAPIMKETLDFFMALNIPIMEVFGMSETSGPQTLSKQPNFFYSTSVGVTPKGALLKIDKPAEDGTGEVCVKGRNTFMGYLNDKEKTEEVMDKDGWLHSGDIGMIDNKGFIFITGRIKELLITAGGENVAPVPIEDKVKERLTCISNCMLIGDKRKFVSILLTLKCEVDEDLNPLDNLSGPALDWLSSIGVSDPEMITVSAVRHACEDSCTAVAKAIQTSIDHVNERSISRACVIQKWVILPKDFSVNGGELGPTLKLRRPIVTKMYDSLINSLYAE